MDPTSTLRLKLDDQLRRVGVFAALARRVGVRQTLRDRRLAARYARASRETLDQVRTEIWQAAADELGAETRRLSPTIVEVRLGQRHTRIAHGMTTSLADRVSGELALDKPLVLRLLAEAGIPVPDHVAIGRTDLRGAERFLAEHRPPAVVKPVGGAGGAGIVGHVATRSQLRAALATAGRYDERVLVEKQVDGDAYRLTFLDGELIDVVYREPPQLTGDGSSTVETLMLREFERRIAAGGDPRGFKPFDVDLDCLFTLAYQGLSLSSVLAADRTVVIRTATNYSGPERSFTAIDAVADELVESCRRAAAALGMRLAGVDVVTADATRPLAETGGVVLEVNAPGLHHHYNVADRAAATRVAVPILASLLGLSPRDWPGTGRRPDDGA